jgi:hypothetical protein
MRVRLRISLIVTVVAIVLITFIFTYGYDQKNVSGDLRQLPQFTDNGDGTNTDNWSKRIWLKNIDCISKKAWLEALSVVTSLADGVCDFLDNSSPGSWRLPDKKELRGLLDSGNFSPVLPPKHPFIGVKDGCFWVAKMGQDGLINPGYMYIGEGGVGLGGMNICSNKYHRPSPVAFYFWPVRTE